MARIEKSALGETPFQKLLGHNKEVMENWTALGEVLEGSLNLSSELKEQVRRTLAHGSGCEYCKAKGKPNPHLFDEKTSIAAGFAEAFIKQNGTIQDSVFQVLKETFSDAEISELVAFLSFTSASQSFGALLKLEG